MKFDDANQHLGLQIYLLAPYVSFCGTEAPVPLAVEIDEDVNRDYASHNHGHVDDRRLKVEIYVEEGYGK
jgi:hypothetical protein